MPLIDVATSLHAIQVEDVTRSGAAQVAPLGIACLASTRGFLRDAFRNCLSSARDPSPAPGACDSISAPFAGLE